MSAQEPKGIVLVRQGIGALLESVRDIAQKVRTVKYSDVISSSDFNAKKYLLYDIIKTAMKMFTICIYTASPQDIIFVSIPVFCDTYCYLLASAYGYVFYDVKVDSHRYPYLFESRATTQYELKQDGTFTVKFEDAPFGEPLLGCDVFNGIVKFKPITGDWDDLIVNFTDYHAEVFIYKDTDGWHVLVDYYEQYNCYSEAEFHNMAFRRITKEVASAIGLQVECDEYASYYDGNTVCFYGDPSIKICDNKQGVMSSTIRFQLKDPYYLQPYLELLNRLDKLPTVSRGDPVDSTHWNELDSIIDETFPLLERAIWCAYWNKLYKWFPMIPGGGVLPRLSTTAFANATERYLSFPNKPNASRLVEEKVSIWLRA